MSRLLIAAIAAALTAWLVTHAFAQSQPQPQVDPRLAAPMVLALRAELSLSDAAIKSLQEDAGKRQQELDAWFKGWFGGAEKPEAH